MDTAIRMMQNPSLILSILYLAYRIGLPSPVVAAEVGVRAPHVRQVLRKANLVARDLGLA
jgi:hypothetical protein